MPSDSGGDVQQHDVLDVAGEHAALNGCADGDALIRVDALVRLLAGDALHRVLHGGNAGRAADQNDLVDVLGGEAGVAQRLIHRTDGLFDQICRQLVELRAGDGHVEVQRALGDERQVDVGAHQAGQLDLRLFRRFLQALQRHAILPQVDAVGLLEFVGDVVDQALVEVVAAQTVVAGGGEHLEDAVADFHQRHVERAAAEVVHEDLVRVALVETVRQRRRGRLVDDALDLETRDAAGVLGRLALRVGEVGRHGDDRLGDGLAQIALGVRLQLLQDHGADLRRGVIVPVDGNLVVGAHLALDGNDGAIRVGDGLTLGDLTDQALAVLGEGDDGRRRAVALGVDDDGRLSAFHDGHTGVRGAQVDADNLAHNKTSQISKKMDLSCISSSFPRRRPARNRERTGFLSPC